MQRMKVLIVLVVLIFAMTACEKATEVSVENGSESISADNEITSEETDVVSEEDVSEQ